MKKKALLILLFLMWCSRPNIIEIPVSRSQIYYGQSVAELYDNFGAPKGATRYAYDVVKYAFITENISVENLDKRLLYCNLWVYAQNNRVIDWYGEGNNCQFKEAEVHRYLDEHREEIPPRITLETD